MKYIKKYEDVADKYAEKKFGFENPKTDFEYKYQNYIEKIPPVAYIIDENKKHIAIFENPKTLNNFDSNVRAIGTYNGDIYVSQRDTSFYHSTMSKELKLTENGEIYNLNTKYVFLYRLNNKKSFAIGISTKIFNEKNERNKKITENILKKIKIKNPQFEFYNYSKNKIYAENKSPIILDITTSKSKNKNGIFNKLKKFIKNEKIDINTIQTLGGFKKYALWHYLDDNNYEIIEITKFEYAKYWSKTIYNYNEKSGKLEYINSNHEQYFTFNNSNQIIKQSNNIEDLINTLKEMIELKNAKKSTVKYNL